TPLFRSPLGHGLLVAGPGKADEPAHRERSTALGADFHRHLKRSATHPAALHLHRGLGVVDRLLEDGHAGLAGALLDQVHRLVEGALGEGLLAFIHQVVHELRDRLTVEARIGRDRPLDGLVAAAHFRPPLAGAAPPLGRLAPYLERLRRRSLTPAESRVPRTMW